MKIFASCITLIALVLGGTTHPVRAEFVILGEEVVDQGGAKQPQNISTDQTKEFDNLYDAHDPRDQVLADLTLYVVDVFFIVVVLLAFLESKQVISSGLNKKTR